MLLWSLARLAHQLHAVLAISIALFLMMMMMMMLMMMMH